MPFPTFPDICPDRSSTLEVENRVVVATFGDGYEQTKKDGINTRMESWNMSFKDYRKDDITQIKDFLDIVGNDGTFYWTPPDELTAKKWRMDGSYNISFPGVLSRSITFKLKRSYEND